LRELGDGDKNRHGAATKESAEDEQASKLLEEVVSRLGLEPRPLALKARTLPKKIKSMTLQKSPMSNKHLRRVTVCLSYMGQENDLRFTNYLLAFDFT
jgi:hypothetical protein